LPGLNTLSQNRDMITSILDTAWSPVAKFRLLSSGVSPNHLLEGAENIVGQKACLACGNCVDACPVVLREQNRVGLQVHRTSLYLETVVEDSCLRCYSCVRMCPQVDPQLKLFAAKHRITEKIVHWWMAIGYFILAGTGISLNHFRNEWLEPFPTIISIMHKIGAVMWLLSPFLFYYFDRYHFKRTMKAVLSLGKKDAGWWKNTMKFLCGKGEKPFQGEYNTGQKTWYCIVLGTMLVLGTTGIIRWFWEDTLAANTINVYIWIHIIAALVIDISFAYHFGRKLLSRAIKRARILFGEPMSFVNDTESPNEKKFDHAKGLNSIPVNKPQQMSQ